MAALAAASFDSGGADSALRDVALTAVGDSEIADSGGAESAFTEKALTESTDSEIAGSVGANSAFTQWSFEGSVG
jgi:hypothetical protein